MRNDQVTAGTAEPLCNLSNKNIGNTGAIIVYLLNNNKMVKKLSDNTSYDGIVAITDCLKNNDSLQELNMSHNMISVDGAKMIAEGTTEQIT